MRAKMLVGSAVGAGLLAASAVGITANASADNDPLYVSLKGVSAYPSECWRPV